MNDGNAALGWSILDAGKYFWSSLLLDLTTPTLKLTLPAPSKLGLLPHPSYRSC